MDQKGSSDVKRHDILARVQEGDLATVKSLIDKNGIHRPFDSSTLLCIAIKFNRGEMVKLLLAEGAEVNPHRNFQMKQSTGIKGIRDTPLHYAVHALDVGIMESLLQKGASVNAIAGSRNSTALYETVFYKKAHMTEILLNYGADMDIPQNNGETPFECAAERGVSFTKMFLERGADPNDALFHAAKVGKVDVVKLLLSHGANLNLGLCYTGTPLHVAVVNRHGRLVEYLFKVGADVNALPSVLCKAVQTGDPVMVNIVLSHHPNVKNKENQNAVRHAVYSLKTAKKGHVYGEIIENLVSYGFTLPYEESYNAQLLLVAIQNSYVKIVREFLNRKTNLEMLRNSVLCDVLPLYPTTLSNKSKLATVLVKYGADCSNTRSIFRTMDAGLFEILLTDRRSVKSNSSVLRRAVWHGHVDTVQSLLRLGADVDGQDTFGRSALHFCITRRNYPYCGVEKQASKVSIEMLKILLARGANTNLTTLKGETPLHLAAQNNFGEIIKILVNMRADVNAQDDLGTSALHHFVGFSNVKLTEYLLSNGADVNAADEYSVTPLHIASKLGDTVMVQLLVDFGANINIQSTAGTPLHEACLRGHTNVVSNLVENGADINLISNGDMTPLEQAVQRITRGRPSDVNFALARNYLLRHMAKMKAADLFLCERNSRYTNLCVIEDVEFGVDYLHCPPLLEVPKYLTKCEQEVASMKCHKISDSNLSFYDVLVASEEHMIKLSANENILQVIYSEDFETRYPKYAGFIQGRMNKGVRLRELREECIRVVFAVTPRLPHVCIEQVLTYLTVADQRMLALVSKYLP